MGAGRRTDTQVEARSESEANGGDKEWLPAPETDHEKRLQNRTKSRVWRCLFGRINTFNHTSTSFATVLCRVNNFVTVGAPSKTRRLAHSHRETPRLTPTPPLVPLQVASLTLVWRSSASWRRCLAYTFSTGASAARRCRSPTLCAPSATRGPAPATGPQISHGTSVYLPFNIANFVVFVV